MTYHKSHSKTLRPSIPKCAVHQAFTLVEMLVAMAVTLLMMAALARAFQYVGVQIQESRADTQLASSLRDVTTTIQNDLARCTVELKPNMGDTEDQEGYFLYYEGPVTDATSTLFRVEWAEETYTGGVYKVIKNLPDSRYGDFDDYLAFTAAAKGDQWFTGKVPRWILRQKTSGTLIPTPSPDDKKLVTIKSKFAEIIYFASPEYDLNTTITPRPYVDVDGTIDLDGNGVIDGSESQNGFPDRIKIHRRVLLIRPDLNLDGTIKQNISTSKIGLATTLHQECDLSVRHVLGENGKPTGSVATNSLSDLSKPHNRFGHFRQKFGDSTSMPLLALGPPATVLTNPGTIAPTSFYPANAQVGFLLPEFVLGWNAANPGLPTSRIGEDVLINNVLGFDLKIFDADASLLITPDTSSPAPTTETISPSDPGYRSALLSTPLTKKGCFVDLAFPILAGGSIRDFTGVKNDSRGYASSPLTPEGDFEDYLVTQFSGLRKIDLSKKIESCSDGLYLSGRLNTDLSTLQPTFDTYTSYYERDGKVQWLKDGVMRWYESPPNSNRVDLGANGLDDNRTTGTDSNPSQIVDYSPQNNGVLEPRFGPDDVTERETLPPFSSAAKAVRVTVRLENPSLRFVRQASVEYRGK